MPKPIVWFDLDGVLADFDDAVHEHYGKEYSELDAEGKKGFWTDVAGNGFYTNLPLILEGATLYKAVAELDAVDLRILTSTGGGVHHAQIAADKAQWVAAFLPDVKPTFCAVPGAWIKKQLVSERAFLIDDNQATVDEWTQAGGVGYWFQRNTVHNHSMEWLKTIRRLAGRGVRDV